MTHAEAFEAANITPDMTADERIAAVARVKQVTVMGMPVAVSTAKMYSVVAVSPANLVTDRGVYVAFANVVTQTDDFAVAKREAGDNTGGPAVSVLMVRNEDGVVIW